MTTPDAITTPHHHTSARLRRRATALLTGVLLVGGIAVASAPASVQADVNEVPVVTRAVRSLSLGTKHTCVMFDNGKVGCWGRNGEGQMGVGTTSDVGDGPGEMGTALRYVDLGTGRTATAIAAGSFHTCALLDTGQVRCWGLGAAGQLGQGSIAAIGTAPGQMGDALAPVDLGTGRTAIALTAGASHTCALLDTRQVKCWGSNVAGQLGAGAIDIFGDGPGEMGDARPTVDLGTGRTARAISAGASHTCAVLDTNQVKCWGSSAFGQLGLGSEDTIGDGPGEMGDALPTVDLGTGRTARALSAGRLHTCALLDNSQVKCWGRGLFGPLGSGSNDDIGDGPGEMGDALSAVDLGTGRSARSVSAGDIHTCALLDNSQVKCWGSNVWGQIGTGDLFGRGDDPGEMGDALPAVDLGTGRTALAVTTENEHTCAVLTTRRVVCWGRNDTGHLGRGDTVDWGNAAGQMGDALAVVSLPGTVGLGLQRPDNALRVGRSAFVGNDVRNTTGRRQTVRAKVPRGATRVITVRVQNDGNEPDRFTVRGTKANKRFAVTYRLGSRNVTRAVTRGRFATPVLQPGASLDLRVSVAPKRAAAPGARLTATVTTTSRIDTTRRDVVRAVIVRRR